MRKKYIPQIIIIVLVMIYAIGEITFLIVDDDPSDDYPNPAIQPDRGSFLIDPATILSALNDGDANVFIPNLEQKDGELPDMVFEDSINWKPNDYVMIVSALNQKVWRDTLEDWKLYDIFFITTCQDDPKGFDYGFMTYFKRISRDYTVRHFSVDPRYTYVEWRGGARYPRPFFGWKSIDLDNLTIDAIGALRIAEKNGGEEIRMKLKNNCSIRLSLSPEGQHIYWKINYSFGNSPKFLIAIDPFTGKIIE